jgi:hypothetical protein
MRQNIKVIALVSTIVIFIALNFGMKLIDWSSDTQSPWVLVLLFGIIAAIMAIGVFLIIKSRSKNKLKL